MTFRMYAKVRERLRCKEGKRVRTQGGEGRDGEMGGRGAGGGGLKLERNERGVGKTDIERLASNDILESVQCKRSHAIGTAQHLLKEKYRS